MKFKKSHRVVLAIALSAATFSTAYADRYTRISESQRAVRYDYAEVVNVRPIYRDVSVERPIRECWQETVTRRVDHGRHSNAASALVGSVIGGVIGHQFGSGRGNDAATVAGALIGAAVGSESARGRGGRHVETESYPIERCDTRIETTTETRIDGYDVTYVYNGQRMRTRMNRDPGRQIKVRVSVAPAR